MSAAAEGPAAADGALRAARIVALAGSATALGLGLGLGLAGGDDTSQALQFCLFATAAPALAALGAPAVFERRTPLALSRWAAARRRHLGIGRPVVAALVAAALEIAWRTPTAVDALVRHRLLCVAEMLSLGLAGGALWLEILDCPPLHARLSRPQRIATAACSMWSLWLLAYLVGLSHGQWYPALAHHAGGLSASADQQFAAGVQWLVAAIFFVPVIFYHLIRWLQSEDDADAELRRLTRAERTRAGARPSSRAVGARQS